MENSEQSQPPSEFQALRDLIINSKEKLPKRLSQVAVFAVEYPDEIAFGTVASIAKQALVQPSTLVRFAKVLGYSGFSEMQEVFQERLRDRSSNYDERMKVLDNFSDGPPNSTALFEGFAGISIRSVERLRDRIDVAVLEQAAQTMAQAETIYLVGQRRSYPITSYMAYAFSKLGIKSVLLGSPAGIDQETLTFATKKDVAFAVSFTPYASVTVDFTRQLAQQNVPLIVVTDSPFSPLISDESIWFEVVETDFAGFRSISATMTLAMALTVSVAEYRMVNEKKRSLQAAI
ncbi:MurR/RpiR family transcriptional regulator [uncultured Cohaesibacter sp.]|uniref:MurR/RpiR family transcriptional regulator n=1 Tax=uncultured Cohaesibacter sp. TaxID=1002546 RepID=UPI0029C78A79|nr:MurR/RpiR family transcriptional regulator [uncultured Cohaesibacter sp.]